MDSSNLSAAFRVDKPALVFQEQWRRGSFSTSKESLPAGGKKKSAAKGARSARDSTGSTSSAFAPLPSSELPTSGEYYMFKFKP